MFMNQYIKWVLPVAVLALAACGPKVDKRGYVSDAAWKEHVAVGTTTKDQILSTFGSPSALSSFGGER